MAAFAGLSSVREGHRSPAPVISFCCVPSCLPPEMAESGARAFHLQHFQNGVRPCWLAVLRKCFPDLHLTDVALPSKALCRKQGTQLQLDVAAVLSLYHPYTGKLRTVHSCQPDPLVGGHPAPTEGAALYLLVTQGLGPHDTLRQLAVLAARAAARVQQSPPAMTPERKRKAVHLLMTRLAEGDAELAQQCPKLAQRLDKARQGAASPATRRCLLSPEAPAALQQLLQPHD